jgi:hypothetical protein
VAVSNAELRQILALIRAQAAVRDQLSEGAAQAVARAFGAVTNFWDTDQTVQAVNDSVHAVQLAQRRMATVTDAYMARTTSIVAGARVAPIGAVDVTRLRRLLPPTVIEALAHAGVTDSGQGPQLSAGAAATVSSSRPGSVSAGTVYGRVADSARWAAIRDGISLDEAKRRAIQRAQIMADTDIMLADRAQASAFLQQRKPRTVTGYRRVLHPELGSGAPPCGLCVVAADRVYHIEELMPIHARCRCTVSAVGEDSDPGFSLNSQDLAKIYKAAGGTGGKGLKNIQVEVTEHGEFGPWLVNAQQRFRGPREYARTQTQDQDLRNSDQLAAVNDQLEILLGRQSGGNDSPLLDSAIAGLRRDAKRLAALVPG